MAIEKIRYIGDPVLRVPCEGVDLSAVNIDELIAKMTETMHACKGIGLAANQIGVSLRIFILSNEDSSVEEYINPTMISATNEVEFEQEGCLSIPGIFTKTKRYKDMSLSWIDKNGNPKESTFTGVRAFAVQHEIDHLNGRLYIDQLGPLKRKILMKKYSKLPY